MACLVAGIHHCSSQETNRRSERRGVAFPPRRWLSAKLSSYAGHARPVFNELLANDPFPRDFGRAEAGFCGMGKRSPWKEEAPTKPVCFLFLLGIEAAHHNGGVVREYYLSGFVF